MYHRKTSDGISTTFNLLVEGEDVMENDVRQAKVDRRAKYGSEDDKKIAYDGPEKRSGKERRIWIDRTQEIMIKMTQRQS